MAFRPSNHHLRTMLLAERPMLSLLDQELLSGTDQLHRIRENWVTLWVDTAHVVQSDCGEMHAERAIIRDGRLVWRVNIRDKELAYISSLGDPFAAFQRAIDARAQRRIIRARWSEVMQLTRDLLVGRRQFDVIIEDAANSPLCGVGIQAFMRQIGMSKTVRLSGRSVALMTLLDRQAGFVLYQAALRHGVLHADTTPARPKPVTHLFPTTS